MFAYILRCYIVGILLMDIVVSTQKPPNIIFILADDMGWNDVSFHGSDQILTPNIDSLAYSGVILQQYYSESICTPARTALLTGKYPKRLGMHGPLMNSENRGIPLTERLLPSYLKELGYTTHLVGKWHVGMSRREFLPTSRGYDTHYGLRGGGIDYYTHNAVETWPDAVTVMTGLDLFDDDVPLEEEPRYILDALTARAVKIIQSHNDSSPLFLKYAPNAPHAGNVGAHMQPPHDYPLKDHHIAHSDRRLFAGVVESLDYSVGQIIRALDETNLLDDTMIIFASDNGAPTEASSLPNWGVNWPLRGTKSGPWEGAVRVPAFIWHSSLRPRLWDGLMHVTDWFPTLIAVAGGQVIADIDGVNQWNALLQESESNRTEVLIAAEDGISNVFASYRAGDYKIVVGNVSGVSNGYYGEKLLANRRPPPEYYPYLRTCEVGRIFERRGFYLDIHAVQTARSATILRQRDPVSDSTLCIPTTTRGCLFNVRLDPFERHDIWTRDHKIVDRLTRRLLDLRKQHVPRGIPELHRDADPAYYDYIWTPWLKEFHMANPHDYPNKSNFKMYKCLK